MAHFGVSRPTLREAVRVLESERLVEVRRGSRTGARVRVPGAEIVARPAGLLLELSGATIADVMVARAGVEPIAVRLLAEAANPAAYDELEGMLVEDIRAGWDAGRLAETTGEFHRRVVELSGNATLTIIAGMLHEITVRHTAFVMKEGGRKVSKADYDKLTKSYQRLITLLRSGDGAAAEAHWRMHLDTARPLLLKGLETVKVRDVMQ
jgi:GntR family transcriptional repressor for pyruvate dehydrogenase complex